MPRKLLAIALTLLTAAVWTSCGEAPSAESSRPNVDAESLPHEPTQLPADGPVQSVYTEISEDHCRVYLEEEPAGSRLECPGPAGYRLDAFDEDARVSISVIEPGGKIYPLDYWQVVTRGFSSLGPRAEWRLTGETPTALIARVNAYDDPNDPEKTTSYLAVAKITADATCVIAVIPPSAEQNVQAREAADAGRDRQCL